LSGGTWTQEAKLVAADVAVFEPRWMDIYRNIVRASFPCEYDAYTWVKFPQMNVVPVGLKKKQSCALEN